MGERGGAPRLRRPARRRGCRAGLLPGPGDVLRLPDPVRETRYRGPDRGAADRRREGPRGGRDGDAVPSVPHLVGWVPEPGGEGRRPSTRHAGLPPSPGRRPGTRRHSGGAWPPPPPGPDRGRRRQDRRRRGPAALPRGPSYSWRTGDPFSVGPVRNRAPSPLVT